MGRTKRRVLWTQKEKEFDLRLQDCVCVESSTFFTSTLFAFVRNHDQQFRPLPSRFSKEVKTNRYNDCYFFSIFSHFFGTLRNKRCSIARTLKILFVTVSLYRWKKIINRQTKSWERTCRWKQTEERKRSLLRRNVSKHCVKPASP